MARLSWPNRLTLARLLLVAPFVICLLNLQDPNYGPLVRWAAITIFVGMSLTDVLDGFLARRFRNETPFGKFLDPLADKILIICAVILLGHEGTCIPNYKLPNYVVVIAIGKDLLVVLGFVLIYMALGKIFIRPRALGKACTAVQLIMVTSILLGPDLPGTLQPLPKILWWAATCLALASAIDYLRIGTRFATGATADRQPDNARPA